MTQLIDRPSLADRPTSLPIVCSRSSAAWRVTPTRGARSPATIGTSRWFVRLSTNPRYDAWLIGWHAHQGVDLHDHGGSAGALYVVEGELLETSGRLDVEGGLRETSTHRRHRARVR